MDGGIQSMTTGRRDGLSLIRFLLGKTVSGARHAVRRARFTALSGYTHSHWTEMPFTAPQLQQFEELGYIVLRGVHSETDMAGWRKTQDDLQQTTLRTNGKLIRTTPSSAATLGTRYVLCVFVFFLIQAFRLGTPWRAECSTQSLAYLWMMI